MKKKLMMVAVLLGVLSLGACVDDNETQSVTDVRNAKAEQLQARADMNNAEAEAQKIQADAEAALMTAKAEAQKAAAAKVNAEAETIKKRTELVWRMMPQKSRTRESKWSWKPHWPIWK